MHIEDRQLIEVPDASGGFDAFYRLEYSPGVRLAYALIGRLDVAEELVQDAFVQAHRRWATISAYDKPGAWFRRTLTHRCLSALRRRTTEARLLLRLGPPEPVQFRAPEQAEELWSALRALPRRQAQVLALVVVEDRAVADVAEILGCTEDTVRTHLRRGRLAMAARLGDDLGEMP